MTKMTSEDEFPEEFNAYVTFLEEQLETPIKIVSVGLIVIRLLNAIRKNNREESYKIKKRYCFPLESVSLFFVYIYLFLCIFDKIVTSIMIPM